MAKKGATPGAEEQGRLTALFSDLPVADGETLHFDFEAPARTLAELALGPENRTPFTVVVKGGWGRGKTTLLRRTKWLLEHPDEVTASTARRRVETLWFNAWKYPSEDTVLAGLLGALLDRLHKGGLVDQLKMLVSSYKGSIVKSVLRAAAPAGLKELIAGVELTDRFSPVEEKRAFHDTFRDLFNQVSRLLFEGKLALRDTGGLAEEQLWSPEKQRQETLAVFLDDLDRCRQERVAEVLEAINLFLDLPGVCFYLGLDWERLVAALPEPVRGQGDQYLEKIVQVALDLPAVSAEGAGGYVRSLVEGAYLGEVLAAGTGEHAGGEGAGAGFAVVAGALGSRHPRHIKRFLNDLALTLGVLRNAGKLGVEEDQVRESAVLAWHLLAEILPPEKWREVRALPGNARAFLQESAARARTECGAEEKGPPETLRLRASGFAEGPLGTLAALSDRRLHILVYMASPAATEVRRSAARGLPDLFVLSSKAWVELKGGTFSMGSDEGEPNEHPVHRVTVSPYRISRHPVTNADYARYVQETGKSAPPNWPAGEIPEGKVNHPVVGVSWSDAEAFCTWLGRRLGAAGSEGAVRLPTEAQWEFAARGEKGRTYPWGSEAPDKERANFGGTIDDTTPVGAYPSGATPEGIFDLAGNVWEWCRDWAGDYPAGEQRDPTGPERGAARVLRGGSFNAEPGYLRGAYRGGDFPGIWDARVGFRLVWSSP